jgi:hypothetical protein
MRDAGKQIDHNPYSKPDYVDPDENHTAAEVGNGFRHQV